MGFILTPECIKLDDEKLKAIINIPSPKTRSELQAIIGTFGYYSRFVKKHATFIDPFRDILSVKNKFIWTPKHEEELNNLKKNFVNSVALSHYKLDRKFYLQTDASRKGISAVLFQIDDEGDERIISLVSRYLTPYEMNYTITELELLAIIYGLIKLQKYLLGTTFKIITIL